MSVTLVIQIFNDFKASVSYHKSSQQTEERNNTAHSSAASAAMAAAQWSHQGQKSNEDQLINLQAPYSEEDIERLAEYSVSCLSILCTINGL